MKMRIYKQPATSHQQIHVEFKGYLHRRICRCVHYGLATAPSRPRGWRKVSLLFNCSAYCLFPSYLLAQLLFLFLSILHPPSSSFPHPLLPIPSDSSPSPLSYPHATQYMWILAKVVFVIFNVENVCYARETVRQCW
ncbi:hypothetical protein HOY80DRAFT_120036 [Tuber brumale]|nr:hypothetical protein HOY80DRAFT_120036 [Tuber brumale]